MGDSSSAASSSVLGSSTVSLSGDMAGASSSKSIAHLVPVQFGNKREAKVSQQVPMLCSHLPLAAVPSNLCLCGGFALPRHSLVSACTYWQISSTLAPATIQSTPCRCVPHTTSNACEGTSRVLPHHLWGIVRECVIVQGWLNDRTVRAKKDMRILERLDSELSKRLVSNQDTDMMVDAMLSQRAGKVHSLQPVTESIAEAAKYEPIPVDWHIYSLTLLLLHPSNDQIQHCVQRADQGTS